MIVDCEEFLECRPTCVSVLHRSFWKQAPCNIVLAVLRVFVPPSERAGGLVLHLALFIDVRFVREFVTCLF